MFSSGKSVSGLIGALLFSATMSTIGAQAENDVAGDVKSSGLITSVPRTMSYQGYLKDAGGLPVSDTLEITFRIYDVESGGSALWTETVAAVSIIDGNFTAIVGETTPINLSFDVDYWMSLQVEGDPLEMDPRLKLHMSAYAARSDTTDYALNSDLLDGLDSGDFAGSAHDHDADYVNEGQANSVTGAMVVDGTVQFGDIGQNGASAGQIMKWNGSAWVADNDETEPGSGSGWADDGNYIRLETGTDSVGIGTATPSEKLEVAGSILVTDKATIGPSNSNTGANAFVAGLANTVSGDWTTIGGGRINTASGHDAVIGGGRGNTASSSYYATVGGGNENTAGADGATISGGRFNLCNADYATVGGGYADTASGASSTIGGGWSNIASGVEATVSGGQMNIAAGQQASIGGGGQNSASGFRATVGGGVGNFATGDNATIAGGFGNHATANGATVGGGSTNTASGTAATVPGGNMNEAAGTYSFAAGRRAKANHIGAFVWADQTNSDFASTGVDQFLIRASGGVGIGTTSPASELDVAGTIQATGFMMTTGASDGYILTSDASGLGSWQSPAPSGGWIDDGNAVRLETVNDSVGIGTATPSEKLDVSGNILVSGTATIGTGHTNTGTSAFLAGENNTASGNYTAVGGGLNNTSSANYATVSGGWNNNAGELNATVSGGWNNAADGQYSVVAGGRENTAGIDFASVGGGAYNFAGISSYATVAGGYADTASGGYATVSGGQSNIASEQNAAVGGGSNNSASGTYATVAGGRDNISSGQNATIGGGTTNTANGGSATVAGGGNNISSGSSSTIGGGDSNTSGASSSTVGGGKRNNASGYVSTIGGGQDNIASNQYATVPGGYLNEATGIYSFAAGRRAKANHDGAFVWGDRTNADITSSAADEFKIRASGGTYLYSNSSLTAGVILSPGASSWTSVSDSTLKRNIRRVNGGEILEKLSKLPISQWSYKAQDESIEHIGPMAQDFYSLFGLGEDDKHISTIDPDGIALAAIQALLDKIERLETRIYELEGR